MRGQEGLSPTQIIMDPNASRDMKDQARMDLDKDKGPARKAGRSASLSGGDSNLFSAGDNAHTSYKGQDAAYQVLNNGRHQTGI